VITSGRNQLKVGEYTLFIKYFLQEKLQRLKVSVNTWDLEGEGTDIYNSEEEQLKCVLCSQN